MLSVPGETRDEEEKVIRDTIIWKAASDERIIARQLKDSKKYVREKLAEINLNARLVKTLTVPVVCDISA